MQNTTPQLTCAGDRASRRWPGRRPPAGRPRPPRPSTWDQRRDSTRDSVSWGRDTGGDTGLGNLGIEMLVHKNHN